jgi:hypothetical protein
MIKRATNGAGPASEFEFDGPSLEDLATEARPLPPSTGSIQKIARAMQIHNFDARRELSRVVMKYKARKRDGQWKDNLSSFARIAVLCDDLLKELRALNPAGKRFLGEARRLESIKIITRLARRTPVKRRKRPNNRPRGSVAYPLLQSLLVDLERVVQKHGGALTLTKNIKAGKPTGSLPDTLSVFRELLPSVVPLTISFNTLYGMRRRARKKVSAFEGGRLPQDPKSK